MVLWIWKIKTIFIKHYKTTTYKPNMVLWFLVLIWPWSWKWRFCFQVSPSPLYLYTFIIYTFIYIKP